MSALHDPVPIAFCITELDRGGAERALTELVLGLDRQAWLPRVFCLGPRGHFTDVLEAGGITVESFNARGVVSVPAVLLKLTLALRRFRPRLLQTFLFHANLLGRVAGRLSRVPVIVSGIRVAERRSRWYGRLDRWTNGLVDHNVCVSQGVADFSIHETGLKSRKVSVISNGVDVERFASAPVADLTSLGISPTRPVVITVGRLEKQKGIEFLLQAAASLLQDRPDCQFLIVGEGHDRASLEAQAGSLGISRSIWFVGARSDVPSLLKAASVFVLASLWEGMPNALLEAMAAGVPVIATDVEGSRELVQSDVTGRLVQPANPAELAQAIQDVLQRPDDSARFAEAAQQLVLQRFTQTETTSAYDSLYRQLMRQR
ncbi:MAG: glycosyltransferase [Planctomycetes bacterium]|nr:glycosyltransferase [Planctomycetota bacterium]